MTELQILTKWEDMIDYGYIALRQYPKSEKHALAQETRAAMWDLGTHLLRAQAIKSARARQTELTKADTALARLRVLLRAGARLKFLPIKKYRHWSSINVELGKMLGGWMAATNNRQ